MAPRTTTTKNRVRRPTGTPSGDFTGRQRAEQARDRAQEDQRERAEAMVFESETEEALENGVFDPQTQERLDDSSTLVLDDDVDDDESTDLETEDDEYEDDEEPVSQPAPRFGGRGMGRPQERVFSGKEGDDEMAAVLAERPARAVKRPGVLRRSRCVVRLNCDIEDMTYGMLNGVPNNFTFRGGLPYSVSVELAEWLDERGLIAEWVSA